MTVVVMLIKAPYNRRFDSFARSYCNVVVRTKDYVVYETITDWKTTAADLGMKPRQFRAFCNNIEVEGGRKVRKGTVLELKPYRNKTIYVRLAEEEYNALKEYADDQNLTVGAALRKILVTALMRTWLNAL
jgi:hypothetical protein